MQSLWVVQLICSKIMIHSGMKHATLWVNKISDSFSNKIKSCLHEWVNNCIFIQHNPSKTLTSSGTTNITNITATYNKTKQNKKQNIFFLTVQTFFSQFWEKKNGETLIPNSEGEHFFFEFHLKSQLPFFIPWQKQAFLVFRISA